MKGKAAIVLLSGVLLACAPEPAPAPAPPPAQAQAAPAAEPMPEHHIVTIRAVSCDALLKLAEDDRASASMFYLGYTAQRRGQRRIDVAEISGLEAAALGYCTENPGWPAATAFMRSFADNGR